MATLFHAKAAGVREEDLEKLAKAASEDGCRLIEPRACDAGVFECFSGMRMTERSKTSLYRYPRRDA